MSISNANTSTSERPQAEHIGWLPRAVYLLLASISLTLGLVGIILPGLPTTPFVLLTSYLLSKSSPRLRRRLLESKLFGSFLKDWQQHKGIRRSVKWRAVALIFIVVSATCWFSQMSPVLLAAVIVAACIGTVIVIALPVVDPES